MFQQSYSFILLLCTCTAILHQTSCTPLQQNGSTTSNTKTCEDVLQPQTCTKLRQIAVLFNEKVENVNEAVRMALQKHITKTQDIIIFVKDYLVNQAKNFKCQNVLSNDQCTKLISVAKRFHVSIANLTRDIEEAITDGITQGKALYQKTIEIMLMKINNLSCEQLIDKQTCDKIRNFATKIHASAMEVHRAIIDAYSKGLQNAQDFLKDAIDYLTNELSCDDVLSSLACSKLSFLCGKFGTSFTKVVDFLRTTFANGVTQITSLYQAATKYIMERWLGVASKLGKRSINEMDEEHFLQFLDWVDNYLEKRF
ncbi:uncharacterized protein [Clytia hemisphaerica]|uniref:uncharacterized protein n=1 Tax=Clytia hemisphaerica TaxID=252671 RepID=UPI0034D748B1